MKALSSLLLLSLFLLLTCCGDDPVGPDPDKTHPTIVSVNPADGAQLVPTDAIITITFSEEIDINSFHTGSQLVDPPFNWIDDYANAVVTITPENPLLADTTYTISISDVRDTAGNAMAGPYTWSFSTSTVAITSPVDGGVIDDSVTIEVAATSAGVIDRVEFFTDISQPAVATDSTAPFQCEFDASSWDLGSEHQLMAKAYDALGDVILEDTVTVHYLWHKIIEDDQFDTHQGTGTIVARDIWKVYARSSDSMLQFRVETSASWTEYQDPQEGIDIVLFFDTDQNPATGRDSVTGVDNFQINDIGAEERIIVGLHGDVLTAYGADGSALSTVAVDELIIADSSTHFEVGVHLDRLGSTDSIQVVAAAYHYSINGAITDWFWDWAPNQGEGHGTYKIDNSWTGSSQMPGKSAVETRRTAVESPQTPFD